MSFFRVFKNDSSQSTNEWHSENIKEQAEKMHADNVLLNYAAADEKKDVVRELDENKDDMHEDLHMLDELNDEELNALLNEALDDDSDDTSQEGLTDEELLAVLNDHSVSSIHKVKEENTNTAGAAALFKEMVAPYKEAKESRENVFSVPVKMPHVQEREEEEPELQVVPEPEMNEKITTEASQIPEVQEPEETIENVPSEEKITTKQEEVSIEDITKDEMPEIKEDMKVAEEMEKEVQNDQETAVITKGMKVTGDLQSDGAIDIIGRVEGNITCKGKLAVSGEIVGNSKAAEIFVNKAKIQGELECEDAVKVGNGSVILGNIKANSAVIAGAVKGDVDIKGPVIVDSTAVIVGNIKSQSVQINTGAVIEGFCSQCYAEVDASKFFESNDIKASAVKNSEE